MSLEALFYVPWPLALMVWSCDLILRHTDSRQRNLHLETERNRDNSVVGIEVVLLTEERSKLLIVLNLLTIRHVFLDRFHGLLFIRSFATLRPMLIPIVAKLHFNLGSSEGFCTWLGKHRSKGHMC